jgi:hypothetical protein
MTARKSLINTFPSGSKVRIQGDTSGNQFIVIGDGLVDDTTAISIEEREYTLNHIWFNEVLELVEE